MSLSREDMARAKFTFSIYDFDGSNKIDAFQLGNALRALGLCPTLKRISNLGGTIQRNEKMLSVEEFLAIYQDAKKDKEEGTYEDYLEALNSYDKDKSGRMEAKTLAHLLQGYGKEPLDRLEAEEIINDCGNLDDEGTVDYKQFIRNLIKGPEIKIPIAMLRATEDAEDSGFELSRRDSMDDWTGRPGAYRNGYRSESETEETTEGKVLPKTMVNGDDQGNDVEGETCNTEKTSNRSQRKPEISNNEQGIEEEKGKLSVPSSARTSRKGSQGQETNGSISPDGEVDVSISSEDVSSRNSLKSGKTPVENGREATHSDVDDISSIDEEGLSKKASGKPGGSGKLKKGSTESATDISAAAEAGSADLSKTKGALKPEKTKKVATTKKTKKEEPPEVKAKFQQPLVSLKTADLFGKKK